ncbi:O-methyltransferase [Telmatospirillum sp. J64-1]|uniref:O-methyltransferase n=1 Tax=Telmatospirillum sp. J64-1 TaxID=2502183 RepID=UPI00115D0D38|nr:class I SAM-dependent methyltransferase [Telmatospirillum sp. J64-1]
MRHIDLSSPQLADYVIHFGTRETEQQRRLREETAQLPRSGMQISPDQGQLLAFVAQSIGTRRALEIGTFRGYSALAVAAILPEGGQLIACDRNEEWTQIARQHWEAAGLAERISLRLGPAEETLDTLIAAGEAGRFDFAFIDADKGNYDLYYERCLTLVRPGGIIALDNVLWHGAVADPADTSPTTEALRALNRKIHEDTRVDMCLVPIGDGLTFVRRR